ncbi:MAG: Rpn family recombination-promoting nuclease/putative transposase [Spirulina sp. SIO3F2]|nr:Rpn family recombination-promoting nuclease/putative transposase [Spirulina sp. SIO3F2]
MALIDLRTDFAFKRVFGSPDSQSLLQSLLNALLYDGANEIEAITLQQSYRAAQMPGVQQVPLTVRAQLANQKSCIIEVQLLSLPTLGKRVLYNAAKSYSFQLSRETNQREILPLLTLNITDFEMFEGQSHYVSHFALREQAQGFEYPNNDLNLVFVELPKFNKRNEQLETVADQWIYFIKHAHQITQLPSGVAQIAELQQAYELAREDRLNREEFDILQQQLFFIADQRQSLSFGREEGLQQGIETGKQQGIQEGMQQGREAGIREGVQQGREAGFQEGIKQGQQKGLQQGRSEGVYLGQRGIVLRLLARRFGKLEPTVQAKIQELPGDRLEALAEAAWDFITDIELSDWLDEQF